MGGEADRLRCKEKQGRAQEDGCTLTQAQKQTHQDAWAVGGVAGLQSSPGPHGVAASGVSLRQTYLVFVKLN